MDKDSEQHMFKTVVVPKNRARKSMDIELKDGFHIVNEYSDVSKIGRGLVPISEEKSAETLKKKRSDATATIQIEQEE